MSHLAVCSWRPALFTLSVDMIRIPSIEEVLSFSLITPSPDPEIIGLAVVVVVVDSETIVTPDDDEGSGQDLMVLPVNL